MRIPRSAALSLALWALAACSEPAATVEAMPVQEENVDGSYYWTFFNAGDQQYGGFRVWLVLKPSESEGMLRVCGLYAADIPEASQQFLTRQMNDPQSYVGFSRTTGNRPTIRLNPGFMAFHHGDLPEQMTDLRAACTMTTEPWVDWLREPKVGFNLGSGNN